MVKPLYKNGKARAVTFSFDDGKPQDVRLIRLFNKYGLIATFNLNGGRCRNPQFGIKCGEDLIWNGQEELRALYRGHEIAAHSYRHLKMPALDDDTCRAEIERDIGVLKQAFCTEIHGFAAPNGLVDPRLPTILKENGIRYQRFTYKEEHKKGFCPPDDFLNWYPDPHFSFYAKEEGKKYLESFFSCNDTLPCLNIWGHSYEINILNAPGHKRWEGMENRWEYVEELFKALSGRPDVWYASNIEICDYVTAMRRAFFDDTYIDNPTNTTLFFSVDGRVIAAPPHTRFNV